MLRPILLVMLVAAALVGQEPPTVPATLFYSGLKPPTARTLVVPAERPKSCAIPLVIVAPKGDYPMRVMKPPQVDSKMLQVKPPAPACNEVNR
jgi:hypothetical protein